MNILFLSIVRFNDINDSGIYTDLMRKFKLEGHAIYVASPAERRFKEATSLSIKDGVSLLKIKTLNIQKTNFIEKGFATITLEGQFLRQIKKHYQHIKFDLVLYSTPPITFSRVVSYIKQKDNAKSYLLLKDIFPQNAVDLGMLKKTGLLYRYFRNKEKKLYALSDYIGCMSPANKKFVIDHNPTINPAKVEVNPNSISPREMEITDKEQAEIRATYGIPLSATVFVYGGNLGKPQGIDFLVEVLVSNQASPNAFFVIVGDGTEFPAIQEAINKHHFGNVLLLKSLPKEQYDRLVLACDVGLIFLHRSFTIPNYPSRLLSYMEAKMPVLAATDKRTDIGEIMVKNGYGLWAESGNLNEFNKNMAVFLKDKDKLKEMGVKSYAYLLANYQVSNSYQIIIEKLDV
ncbi:glycosyltransferase family 4 protein [Pedobacter frigiditerrae]|uniref:glycosyltransferase family 4 protein n=1 Tax=Pedobacter frigiditerrae TaxID=2530452 RepID=UPI00292DCD61|nr:glycosyltransferase family 4 protein [Pedobacter frigiditerrae]